MLSETIGHSKRGGRMKGILIGLSVLLLVSCAHQMYPGVADPSVRINNVSGVSVLPPQDQGWLIPHMSLYELGFVKRGDKPDATYAAQVKLFQLPKIDSEEQYLKYVSEGRAAGPETRRFKIIQNKEEIYHGREGYCVKHHSVSEDKAAKTQSGPKGMVLETIGYNCQHPKNKAIGVYFEYSYRHHAGDEDSNLEKKANAFLDQVRFTDF
jgi:hypothetical protein